MRSGLIIFAFPADHSASDEQLTGQDVSVCVCVCVRSGLIIFAFPADHSASDEQLTGQET